MKVLYVAPEHVSGGFELFAEGHRRRGNDARWVTFFRNLYGFKEDICFDLIGMPTSPWVYSFKKRMRLGDQREFPDGAPLFRRSENLLEKTLFAFRDALNAPRLRRTIEKYGLNDFDIYHFEQGADPFRDSRWVRELARRGKGIVCFYHGTDLRNRGAFEAVHRLAKLNLTSEIDLLDRFPDMRYLYLPINVDRLKPSYRPPDGRIRICHAARNRAYKGSDIIESIVFKLAKRYPIDWLMIENLPHAEAINLKATADIFIDQITDSGGWGYGASSVEALALGLPTVTRINSHVEAFLGVHPFINADMETLERRLIELVENPDLRVEKGREGRNWVTERHGLDAVMGTLYAYYREVGFC